MRRGLVLGAGGPAGIAWEVGFIAGMADGGIDLREADLFVGTSAGAVVAAQITSGTALEDLFREQVDPDQQIEELTSPVDFNQLRRAIAAAKSGGGGAVEILRRVGALALAARTVSESERRHVIASRLPVHAWPDDNLLVTAVDADSGERHIFDRASGATLVDAVAASCAIPGIWPPVSINGHHYMDGGTYSTDNADVAVGCDRVLIVALRSSVPPLAVMPLDSALESLRRGGARVEVVHPDQATEAAFASVGGDLLDPSVREQATRAGRQQGRSYAGAVLDRKSSTL
jgi:NTE family protein